MHHECYMRADGVDYRGAANGNEWVKADSWWDGVAISAGPTITDVLIAPICDLCGATFVPFAEISLTFPENINASGGRVFLVGPNGTGPTDLKVGLTYTLSSDGLSMVVQLASANIIPPVGGASYKLFFTQSSDATAISNSYGYLHRFSDIEPLLSQALIKTL